MYSFAAKETVKIKSMYMEIVSIERKTFEAMVAKFDRFVSRMDAICQRHGEKTIDEWMDNMDGCLWPGGIWKDHLFCKEDSGESGGIFRWRDLHSALRWDSCG